MLPPGGRELDAGRARRLSRPRPRRAPPAAARPRRRAPWPWSSAPSGPRRSHSSSRRARLASDSSYSAWLRRTSSRRASEVGVAPGHREQPVRVDPVELEHAARDVLEEVAVVARDHEGERRGGEQLLERQDAVEIEMVGRLVEQQDVGLARQRARRSPAACASRRRASPPAAAPSRKPSRPSARAARPAFCDASTGSAASASSTASSALESCSKRGSCGTSATRTPLRTDRVPASASSSAGEDAQQRRLAGAVGADQPDPVALGEGEGEPAEQRARAELPRHAVERHEQGPGAGGHCAGVGGGSVGGRRGAGGVSAWLRARRARP